MKSNVFTGELTWRGALAALAVLVGAAGLCYAGRLIYRQIQSRPVSVAATKREIFRFLKEKSGRRDFAINLQQAALDTASVSNDLLALRAEVAALQTNIAGLQTEIRTNREEIASATLELRKLKRAAGLLPRKNLVNKESAAMTDTNRLALLTNLSKAGAAEPPVSTNLNPTLPDSGTPSLQHSNDLAAASLTNESLKVILEKDQALSARQDHLAGLQQEIKALFPKLNVRQKAVNAKQSELNGLQNGTALQTKIARDFQQQIQQAMSWELLYKALGQELWLADHLLADTNPPARRTGLQLADQARAQALNSAENGWLAARIIEAFIWPNLALADNKSANTANADDLLISAGLTFQQASETNNYLKNAQILISQSSNPVRADFARYRVATTLELMGNYEDALKHLRAIQSSNSLVYASKRITVIEGKLKAKLRKKG